jgi:hypothetical protein
MKTLFILICFILFSCTKSSTDTGTNCYLCRATCTGSGYCPAPEEAQICDRTSEEIKQLEQSGTRTYTLEENGKTVTIIKTLICKKQ